MRRLAGYATVASLLNKGLIYLPVLFLLEAAFGMYGIIFTAAATDFLSIFAAGFLCRLALWREKKTTERTASVSGEPLRDC